MTEDEEERRLVEQVIAGRPGAVEEFVDRYGPVVVKVLRGFRISQEDRDDCFQDVFVKLCDNDHRPLRAWRGGSLSGYIAVIARRVAINLVRTRNPEVPWEPGFDPPNPGEPGGDGLGLPSEEVIREVARNCLTPRHFEIYERYCRGETPAEIATALNITPNYVFVGRYRMIRALRECLKRRGLWP